MVKLMDESADFLIKDTVTSAMGVSESLINKRMKHSIRILQFDFTNKTIVG